MSDFIKEKKRPASYADFNIPVTNKSGEKQANHFEKRKYGSIYFVSQVEDLEKSPSRAFVQRKSI